MTPNDVCGSHQDMVVSLSRLENKIDNINEKLTVFSDHIKESVKVRDDVRDVKRFTCGATRALWIAYTAIAGLVIKVIFFGGRG